MARKIPEKIFKGFTYEINGQKVTKQQALEYLDKKYSSKKKPA
jgi:hypothetical protein